jgi:hypothetical protein
LQHFRPSFCTFNAQRGNTWIAIPIKEARETMHASLVYVKGMYQRNAVKEFFKRMQIGKF